MKLENKASRDYIAFDVILKANSVQEIENKEAIKILLKQKGVAKFVDVAEAKALETENEKLKKQLELAQAKEEAIALGIQFNPNIGLAKLQEKIAKAKEEKEE